MGNDWIDAEGFRANVGIILANSEDKLMLGGRVGAKGWQFPQGGISLNEDPRDAMYRELWEETGLKPDHVSVLGATDSWLRYKLPQRLVRRDSKPLCIGQKQKWFLLEMLADDNKVTLNNSHKPEFDGWRWVSYWYPLGQVVPFKRDVYRRAMKELAPRHSKLVSES